MTILKEASAPSISRPGAANVVIVITIKKGKFDKKPTFELNSTLMKGEKPDIHYIPQMSSSDVVELEKELYSRGFYRSKLNSSSKPVVSPVVDVLDMID